MRHHRTQAGSDEHRRLDRAIVLELLEERERWTRDELAAAVRVDRSVLDSAVERLQADGVAVIDGDELLASRCARRIDELELIGI
ncbi:MAG TPA: HTH domain-containing protein [Solirubrobacteraceae bacterium]|nr:HTH domain-containing protein [Solirubrobacteraceae bacterium]